jgi:SAM-dependent methyltransferase
MTDMICRVCEAKNISPETAKMHGASREVMNNIYTVWKCECGTINAFEEIDFQAVYKNYPMHMQKYDLFARVIFSKRLRLLKKFGLKISHRILDYGCGSGFFVKYLQEKGYDCHGFDPFSEHFANTNVLSRPFDFVMAQDVIEHVDRPSELLEKLGQLTKVSGSIVLGTPYSDNVDMYDPVDQLGLLHQPFHRFVVSWNKVPDLCKLPGWRVDCVVDACYVDTPIPFANSVFLFRLFKSGGAMDFAFEPIKPMHFLRNPSLFFWGFFGFLFPAHQTLFAVMRRTS